MGGKRIDCYLDLTSFFSYVAFIDLVSNMETLAAHGVEVEFHPVLLGAINSLSGNEPPWTLPAKATYLTHDSQRAAHRVGLTAIQPPKNLLAFAHTISPLRALHFIKAHHPPSTFLSAMHFLFHVFWTPSNVNLTADANLRESLLKATTEMTQMRRPEGRLLFTEPEVGEIMEGRAEMKEALKEATARAVELGAFGAPWFWVVDGEGRGQPFFGSDRFNHMYKHLGIPFQDVAVLPPSKL